MELHQKNSENANKDSFFSQTTTLKTPFANDIINHDIFVKGVFILTYYLAVDIGASSGRHILGWLDGSKLHLQEIYRFENSVKQSECGLVWDTQNLFSQIKQGLKKCVQLGMIPKTVAIDTWGVDYVLLDSEKQELLPAMAYRDARTALIENEVANIFSQDELYAITGIQKLSFNTIYQLYCDKKSGKLNRAAHFLMIPEYLSFKLTGKIRNEYTNATTTNLINAETKTWDDTILSRLGLAPQIFCTPALPGTSVGYFSDEIKAELGFDAEVILCPSHDTASAVAACPVDTDCVYISSGTWSLIGTENLTPILSEDAKLGNFTNEGGIEYRFRFLKNIPGMWLFQNIRREIDKKLTYDELMHLAEESEFDECIDLTLPELLAPESMIDTIRSILGKPELALGDVLKCIYLSLAKSYAATVREIEAVCNKEITTIHIAGGGSKDKYLNKLTHKFTGKTVCTGLQEATATGNILSQIMKDTGISLKEGRDLIKKSFKIKEVM